MKLAWERNNYDAGLLTVTSLVRLPVMLPSSGPYLNGQVNHLNV